MEGLGRDHRVHRRGGHRDHLGDPTRHGNTGHRPLKHLAHRGGRFHGQAAAVVAVELWVSFPVPAAR